MIDDVDFAARLAYPAHLVDQALRMRNDRDDVHRDDFIEAIGGKRHALGIHHVQIDAISDLLAREPHARAFQHLGGNIDSGHARVIGIERQR